MNKTDTKAERVAAVNALIKAIGSHGRRFFWDEGFQRYAEFRLGASGRLFYLDEYTSESIEMKPGQKWNGFCHGGTLRGLVEQMATYIKTGKQIALAYIGLERGDGTYIWGYSHEAVMTVRAEALLTGVIKEPTKEGQEA